MTLLWTAHGMCEAYYREKAGLSSGGSGLKYPMWNVERSSLSTDRAKNMQWSVTLVHQVYRRLLWLNMLWTVQGLHLEGIRMWQCWSLKSLSEMSWCFANASSSRSLQQVPLERGAGPESQADLCPFPRFILCFTQLFTHHRPGLASLKGQISCSSVRRKLQFLKQQLLF